MDDYLNHETQFYRNPSKTMTETSVETNRDRSSFVMDENEERHRNLSRGCHSCKFLEVRVGTREHVGVTTLAGT